MGYFYVFLTIAFTIYGQLILKSRIVQHGNLPVELTERIAFFFKLFADPYILSGFIAAFIAALAWMSAMTQLELSKAYPLMSLSFVGVLIFSALLLHEPVTWPKTVGIALIMAGTIIVTRG